MELLHGTERKVGAQVKRAIVRATLRHSRVS